MMFALNGSLMNHHDNNQTRRSFLKTGAVAALGLFSLAGKDSLHARVLPVSIQDTENIIWFKKEFSDRSVRILRDTPFDVDFLAAVALQETGYYWTKLREKGLSTKKILELCVGDTLDYPARSRTAFPKDKAELINSNEGQKMFEVARESLKQIGEHEPAYMRVFEKYPDKFCHGFGIFQYDLQFFKNNPEFFLEKKWLKYDECLRVFVKDELVIAQKSAGYEGKKALSHDELVYVAIAYNRGRVEPDRGFKQGHKNSSTGKYYGEYIDEYLKLARQI
jgi:hypothetical protein